jgi:AraC family transcriptional regulator, transcriptional activator of pobA
MNMSAQIFPPRPAILMPQRSTSLEAITDRPVFQIREIENFAADPLTYPLKPWQGIEILWVIAGECRVKIHGRDVIVGEGRLATYSLMGATHQVVKPGSKVFQLSCTPCFLYQDGLSAGNWLTQYGHFVGYELFTVAAGFEPAMKAIFAQLREEYRANGLDHLELLRGLLNMYLLYVSRLTGQNGPTGNRDQDLVTRFMRLLHEEFTTRKLVCDYAEELCVSPNHLNRTVKSVSGHTASFHIQQQIINEAKRMATYSRSSMKEIAYYLGFDEISHFSKFFKNKTGSNFRDFKRDLQQRVA